MHLRTLEAFLKARGWSRAELARRVGVSRQAVSLWFQEADANVKSRHLLRLSEVLRVPMEDLVKPLPCFDVETHARLRATLLWDRLFPDLDDLAVALNRFDLRAVGRLVDVYGLYAVAKMLGERVWHEFPRYKRYLPPARRRQLETLWSWHQDRKVA